MPSVHLSIVNIALNSFGFIITLIIFSSCLIEWVNKKNGSWRFLFLLGLVLVSLAFDIVSWICEGNPEVSTLTIISNTAATCTLQLALLCFMEFLRHNLYLNSKSTAVTLSIFRLFCLISIAYSIGNAFYGYSFSVNETGHYVHSENVTMVILHLLFSITTFVTMILMALFANRSTKQMRFSFIKYTIFPIVGIIIDYTHHGISLTYVSVVTSILVIYTDVYMQRQKMIDAQQNALLLSQINPHFTYNTLSAIAAMCDSNPKLAKNLTIDFARYMRKNLENVSADTLIPFEKELEHVECYLKIEKARFRERLNIIYSIQCKDFCVPPLTVQPLVENAVKHGVTKKISGGTVKIITRSTDESYIIEIIDDGVGFDTESAELSKSHHVGLSNVRSRLSRMCRGNVRIKSTKNVGTRVSIEIPRRRGKMNEHSGS